MSAAADDQQQFNKLKGYVKKHGHSRVPQFYTVDGHPLGRWVVSQRNRYVHGILPPDRAHQLEALPGWTWDPRTDQWEEGFRRLVDYVQRKGDAGVSPGETVDGYKLGAWVRRQRHAESSLDADRASRLEALPGWTWRADRMDTRTSPPKPNKNTK